MIDSASSGLHRASRINCVASAISCENCSRQRFAGIDEHQGFQIDLRVTAQAAEAANHRPVIYHRDIGRAERGDVPIVLVRGYERQSHLVDFGLKRVWRLLIRSRRRRRRIQNGRQDKKAPRSACCRRRRCIRFLSEFIDAEVQVL